MKAQTALVLCAIVLALPACDRKPGTGGETNTRPNTPGVMELKASECKALGGKVEAASICGGQNQKCVTVTVNPVTGAQEAHELCINEAG